MMNRVQQLDGLNCCHVMDIATDICSKARQSQHADAADKVTTVRPIGRDSS